MKILNKILLVLVVILVVLSVNLYLQKDKVTLDIKNIRKQNDSLLLAINKNNKKIDSISNKNDSLIEKNVKLKKKLVSTNIKAENYKKEHEKNVSYINNLSNNDVAELFTDKFK